MALTRFPLELIQGSAVLAIRPLKGGLRLIRHFLNDGPTMLVGMGPPIG